MGMCFSEGRSSPKPKKVSSEGNSKRQFKAAQLIVDINPQNAPETQMDLLSPCPTVISVPSSVVSHTKVKSMVSLEQALMNEHMEMGESAQAGHLNCWMQSHNTPSSLMKMTKGKMGAPQKQDSGCGVTRRMIDQLENCDNVSAALLDNNRMSSIVVSGVDLDIEFILPKGRAGPLVVPYICYQKYATRGRNQ